MFAIYIPGRCRNDESALHDVGAGWAIDRSVNAMYTDVLGNGPDGGSGKLVSFDHRKLYVPGQIAFIDLETQRWEKAAACDGQPEGRYWIGLPKDRKPGPDELQRDDLADGLPIMLRDRCEWVAPVVEYLPKRLKLNRSTGEEVKAPREEDKPLVTRTNAMLELLLSEEFQNRVRDERVVDIPRGLAYAAMVLGKNYRVNLDLIDMLDLVGDFEAVKIAGIATGLELLKATSPRDQSRLLAMSHANE